MSSRRLGIIFFSIGVSLLWTPLYWEALMDIGVTAALDPVTELGPPTRGGYSVAVGAAAMCVGGAGILQSETDEPPTNTFLTSCLLSIALSFLAIITFIQITNILAIQVAMAGASPGFASVRGAANTASKEHLGTGLMCASLAPLISEPIFQVLTTSGWSMYIGLVLSVTLIVYTAVLSYPFYRLGRTT